MEDYGEYAIFTSFLKRIKELPIGGIIFYITRIEGYGKISL
jgi:hypothetical protein